MCREFAILLLAQDSFFFKDKMHTTSIYSNGELEQVFPRLGYTVGIGCGLQWYVPLSFSPPWTAVRYPPGTKASHVEWVVRLYLIPGGFPGVVVSHPHLKQEILSSYLFT